MKSTTVKQLKELLHTLLPKKSTPLDCLLLTFATATVMVSGVGGSGIPRGHATETRTVSATEAEMVSMQSQIHIPDKGLDSMAIPECPTEPQGNCQGGAIALTEPIPSAASGTTDADPSDSSTPPSSEILPEDLMTVIRILMSFF